MSDYPAKKVRPANAAELALWSQLVTVAALTAKAPDKAGPMTRARKALKGKPMPQGQYAAGTPFDRLARLSLRWTDMLIADRRAQAAELAQLAAQCRVILTDHNQQRADQATAPGSEQALPMRRHRADIDG